MEVHFNGSILKQVHFAHAAFHKQTILLALQPHCFGVGDMTGVQEQGWIITMASPQCRCQIFSTTLDVRLRPSLCSCPRLYEAVRKDPERRRELLKWFLWWRDDKKACRQSGRGSTGARANRCKGNSSKMGNKCYAKELRHRVTAWKTGLDLFSFALSCITLHLFLMTDQSEIPLYFNNLTTLILCLNFFAHKTYRSLKNPSQLVEMHRCSYIWINSYINL